MTSLANLTVSSVHTYIISNTFLFFKNNLCNDDVLMFNYGIIKLFFDKINIYQFIFIFSYIFRFFFQADK